MHEGFKVSIQVEHKSYYALMLIHNTTANNREENIYS